MITKTDLMIIIDRDEFKVEVKFLPENLMFLCRVTIESAEPAKRDHCVAARRQQALVS